MDSDDSNISDHVGDLDIQSYQFEPLCNDEGKRTFNIRRLRYRRKFPSSGQTSQHRLVRFCLFVNNIKKKHD